MRGRRRMLHMVSGILVVALFVSCGDDDDSDDGEAAASDTETAADADLGPLPQERDQAREWVESNRPVIDEFRQAGGEVVDADDVAACTAVAEKLNARVGSIETFLREAASSPDAVLAELLASAAISARAVLEACLDGALVAEDDREGLANGLVLIERRVQELEA